MSNQDVDGKPIFIVTGLTSAVGKTTRISGNILGIKSLNIGTNPCFFKNIQYLKRNHLNHEAKLNNLNEFFLKDLNK
jgi:hypothetical protein